MKLIEFLISKGCDGWKWPNGIRNASCNACSRDVIFHFEYCPPSLTETLIAPRNFDSSEIVTREQYEAALAASKPEWDGEGLPPVGSKVSFFYNERYNYNEEIIPQDGQELEVVAHKTTTDEHDVAVCYWDENGGGMAVCLVPGSLRPIRSEADKKKEEAIKAIDDAQSQVFDQDSTFSEYLYDAIAAGKIPHIRID